MRPLTVRLAGDYTDAYLYLGKLFLLRDASELVVLSWDKIVASLAKRFPVDPLVFQWAMGANDDFYNLNRVLLLGSDSLKRAIVGLLEDLSKADLVLEEAEVEPFVWYCRDLGHDDVVDLHLYMKRVYFSSENGTFASDIRSDRTKRVTDPVLIHDAPARSFATNWRRLCFSAGQDGLFLREEVPPKSEFFDRPSRWRHLEGFTSLRVFSNFADFSSVTLDHQLVYVADKDIRGQVPHKITRRSTDKDSDVQYVQTRIGIEASPLKKLQVIPYTVETAPELLEDPIENYRDVVGCREKLFFFENGTVHSFLRWSKDERYKTTGRVDVPHFDPIDVAVGNFGMVLDERDAVYLVTDDGVEKITDTPSSRVRTFPQSRWYQNVFTSVQDDHVMICSCVSDLLRDQWRKKLGVSANGRSFYE